MFSCERGSSFSDFSPAEDPVLYSRTGAAAYKFGASELEGVYFSAWRTIRSLLIPSLLLL